MHDVKINIVPTMICITLIHNLWIYKHSHTPRTLKRINNIYIELYMYVCIMQYYIVCTIYFNIMFKQLDSHPGFIPGIESWKSRWVICWENLADLKKKYQVWWKYGSPWWKYGVQDKIWKPGTSRTSVWNKACSRL